MSVEFIINGLIQYGLLLFLLSCHEAGHAAAALACGDDTAKKLGRVTINPIAHIDLVGTVLLPLLMIFGGSVFNGMPMIFGWAKPVPFVPSKLRNPQRDGVLIAMAGPAVNLLLACLLLPLAKLGGMVAAVVAFGAYISLILCFFNLIPVPPLDGSHVLKYVTGMSDLFYARLSQLGFIVILVIINIPIVRLTLAKVTSGTFDLIARLYGLPYG